MTLPDENEYCVVCDDSRCLTPIPPDDLEERVCRDGAGERLCEAQSCHVVGPQDEMVLLFRECWYCPSHAREQLAQAAQERGLAPDEAATLCDLGGDA